MTRRRRSKPSPVQPIAAMVGLVVLGYVFFPQFRTIAIIILMVAVAIGLGYLTYRIINRNQSSDAAGVFPKQTSSTTPPPPLPAPAKRRYVTRKSVLTKAEIVFHKVLLEAVPEAPVFPKVRVADVMEAAERYSGDFLRISQKHFDWVLCHPETFEPLIAIELDDASHQWSDKQRKNDKVKDDAASEAGITLLRFPWQKDYNVETVRDRIGAILDKIADQKEPVPPLPEAPVASTPASSFSANAARDALDELVRNRRASR